MYLTLSIDDQEWPVQNHTDDKLKAIIYRKNGLFGRPEYVTRRLLVDVMSDTSASKISWSNFWYPPSWGFYCWTLVTLFSFKNRNMSLLGGEKKKKLDYTLTCTAVSRQYQTLEDRQKDGQNFHINIVCIRIMTHYKWVQLVLLQSICDASVYTLHATAVNFAVTYNFDVQAWIPIITLRAKLSGAVYCNRSCMWVCLCVGLLPR